MSAAVITMMLGLFAIPWTLAGLINPSAVWMKGASRGKVLLCGSVAFVVLLVAASLLTGPPPADGAKVSGAEGTLAVLWLLACIAWPFIALVAKARTRAALPQQSASTPATKPPDFLSKPQLLSKAQRKKLNLPKPPVPTPPAPAKAALSNAAQASKPTRAIRTGWQLCEVEFMYEDAKGETTFRMVTVHWVGDTSFKGECHDRHAERTFRLDRVIGDITDIETGEILEPEDWADRYRS